MKRHMFSHFSRSAMSLISPSLTNMKICEIGNDRADNAAEKAIVAMLKCPVHKDQRRQHHQVIQREQVNGLKESTLCPLRFDRNSSSVSVNPDRSMMKMTTNATNSS